VRQKLRKQLAAFLKRARGEMSYAQFAKRMGISAATLHRIEMCNQNVTIDTLEEIKMRLKATMSNIFPE
jgi:transcriptional regulator with XRE-family HTH domain